MNKQIILNTIKGSIDTAITYIDLFYDMILKYRDIYSLNIKQEVLPIMSLYLDAAASSLNFARRHLEFLTDDDDEQRLLLKKYNTFNEHLEIVTKYYKNEFLRNLDETIPLF